MSSTGLQTGQEAKPPEALGVSSALALAKSTLEGVTVRILGEVSEVNSKRGYKAVFFSVKDESASLPCLMWTNRYEQCGLVLEVGQLVELSGRFSVHIAKGRMSFDVFSIRLAGEGNLRLQVANLAKRLEAEGLTADDKKRPLVPYPKKIGLVTSPRGAAVHDVLRTLRRRYPLAEVCLAGVPVEGKQAAEYILQGMREVYRQRVDVILLVRGGGSFEDLMPFNDEALARAIVKCPIPVVTGIGHETDTCIADLVADLRASTPTAAAEAAAVSFDDIREMLDRYGERLTREFGRQLERANARWNAVASRPVFAEPDYLLSERARNLDASRAVLEMLAPRIVADRRHGVELAQQRLFASLPAATSAKQSKLESLALRLGSAAQRQFEHEAARADVLEARLISAGSSLFDSHAAKLAHAASRLDDLSPLAVLGRGYAYARNESGAVVYGVDQAPPGSRIEVNVHDGRLNCLVEDAVSNGKSEGEA